MSRATPGTVIEESTAFILSRVERWKGSTNQSKCPLFVGIQGPQGIGKSYLTNGLYEKLTAAPYKLRLAFLSLDDLYATHKNLVQLQESNPTNKLLHGRGLPGTHDLTLATSVMERLKNVNQPNASVDLPIYDKSLFSGQGDRSEEVKPISGPIDVVIFEGWMVGFYPISEDVLKRRYKTADIPPTGVRPRQARPYFRTHSLQDLVTVNTSLKRYTEELWPYLNTMVHLEPENLDYTFDWRLEQEHNMKAKNNGKGMTDEEVEKFVAKYMPAYELFGEGVDIGYGERSVPWAQNLLKLTIGRGRQIVKTNRSLS